jgi:hypothetical protein
MWNKKWHLKRNISCDACLLLLILEGWVLWDDAIEVSAGKLKKLWDSLSELRSSLCKRRLERTVLRSVLLPVKTAQFNQLFRQVWRHTVKSLSLTECIQPFIGGYQHIGGGGGINTLSAFQDTSPKIIQIILNLEFLCHSKRSFYIMKITRLELFEVIALCYENFTRSINIACEKSVDFLVFIFTTGNDTV